MRIFGKTALLTVSALWVWQSVPAVAQETGDAQTPSGEAVDEAEAEAGLDENGQIVVFGTRLKGQLVVDQPPIAEFDEADIAAFGASSIEDLLAAIEPATGSSARGGRGGGRPVFLINGIRVSSWREFRSYPPEAVAKVEVFPEEVAQRFGYSPNQRVVNIILKPNFQLTTAEVEYEQPAAGGYSRNEQELTWLRIGENGRLNLDLEFEDRSPLTEAERGLTLDSAPGQGKFRTLVSDTFGFQAEANYARALIESGTSLSLNGTVARNETQSLSGLAADGVSVLERRGDTDSYSAGLSVNQPLGDWVATLTSDNNITRSRTDIDRDIVTGFDTARSRVYSTANKLTVNGFPLELPAGEVSTTLDLFFDWNRIESEDTRAEDDIALTRRGLAAGLTVSAPLVRGGGALAALGDVTLTGSGGIEDQSDFGNLANWSLGVNWSPSEALNLSATRIWRQVAPGLGDLGNPQIEERNSTVFDYRSRETVLATLISGGNPNLAAETQSDWKFSANWRLPFWEDARISADYGINRSRDVTATPGFSSAFEQAFPARVKRDGAGDLLSIDRSPLTLYRTRSEILSFGFNANGQIGRTPEPVERGNEARQGGNAGTASGQGGGAFDPARMQALRETFCNTPEGQTPDLSQIPETFRARLLDENGNPDPEKIAAARQRFCGAEADAQGERFAAIRAAVCADPPDLDALPEAMLTRLRNEDGEIDPEKLKTLRERMCSAEAAQPQSGEAPRSGGRGGRRGGGSPFGGNDEDTRPRYFVSLNHTINLQNDVLLSENGPFFDQLDGFVLSGGAVSEQTSRLEGGIFWQGYGLRLSGRYTGEAVVRGGDFIGASNLFFGDLATFDVRLFANLGEILEREEGWMKDLRVSLMMDNVFDSRRRVVDETGTVPEAYKRFRIDPTGRYIGIDIRKAF